MITPEALAVADLATQAKKLTVVMNAAKTSIITMKLALHRALVAGDCRKIVEVLMAAWAFQNGVKKVFTIVSDYAPGLDAESSFQRAYNGRRRSDPRFGPAFPWPIRISPAFVQRAKDFVQPDSASLCSSSRRPRSR